MAHVCGAPVHRAFAFRTSQGRKAVVVRAQTDPPKVTSCTTQGPANLSLMAAAALILTSGPVLSPPELMLLQPARAEDMSDDGLTPYQRRQRELERRRELLRQARDIAEGRAAGEVAAPSTEEADAAIEASNAERRAAANQLASELKSSAAAAYESSTAASHYRGFGGFSAPTPASEPAAAPAPPLAPVIRQAEPPKPAREVEVKKQEAKKQSQPQPAGKQKRRGPLPLFLAELLVLGSFAGLTLAVTKYSKHTNKALALAGAKGKELYVAAEEALAKVQQSK